MDKCQHSDISTNVARRLTEGSKVVVDLAFTIVSVRARGLRLTETVNLSHFPAT